MNAARALEQHRAWRAWQQLGVGIDAIAFETHRESRSKQRAIYFVRCADGARVVAKLARKSIIEYESVVYDRLLPLLPVPTPHYFGTVTEDNECGWIFLEHVGGERISPLDPAHRRLAAAWLADAHSAAFAAASELALRDAGPACYLEHMHAGRSGIIGNLGNPAFDASHRNVLERVLRCCDRLERAWSDIVAFSDSLPRTFVHGDFRPKNVHVRGNGARRDIVAMDWETSGHGPCGVDLAPWHRDADQLVVDLSVYAERVSNDWPGLTRDTLERGVRLGQVFRQLAGIDWAVPSLPYVWPDKPIGRLRAYADVLEDALERPPWMP